VAQAGIEGEPATAIGPGERCPACGGELASWRTASASDPDLAGDAEFELDRCDACGTAVTRLHRPPPDVLYEGGTYAAARGGIAGVLSPLRRLAERDRMRFVHSIPAGGAVVEVGAGDGKLVAAMIRAGYRARGIDPSPAACAAAAAIGAPVDNAGIEDAAITPGTIDGVVIWHALEHLPDPAVALASVRRWLRPGGALVVAVPNLAGLQATIGGDRWFHQDVPRHRTHFTPAGLEALLERTGFAVTRIRHLAIEQNPLGMWQTLLNRLTRERDFFFRLLKRDLAGVPRSRIAGDAAVTIVAGALLVPIALALELAAGIAGRGGSMVAEATAR
jgi:2-polyprenyl-3-methyl-5-hydroxy-6-metoxy-1,4-benzoquinol methylase